jgi:hypothetical protein
MTENSFEAIEPLPGPDKAGRLTNQQILLGKHHDPLELIKIYDEDEWEEFTREWVEGIRGEYTDVRRAGGARDKGRDVIAYVQSMNVGGPWDNYQCKHYNHALHPTDLWPELAKLCYYTFEKKYSMPRAYYFAAPWGLGPEAILLMEDPENLRAGLILRWARGDLLTIGKKVILLEGELKKYVEGIDFSIVKDLPPPKIIEAHRQTRYHGARFGGGLVRLPPDKADVPEEIAPIELRFVQQLLEAYADHLSAHLETTGDLEKFPDLRKHFFRQRTHFYLAELLRNFTRDNIPEEQCYERLQEAIYDGVIDTAEGSHANGLERLKKTIAMARLIQIDSHPLKECLEGYHRSGICHQLANEDRLKWVP